MKPVFAVASRPMTRLQWPRRAAIALLLGTALLAGCAPGVTPSTMSEATEHTVARQTAPWWNAFADDQLSRLMIVTLARNLDIEIALARLDEAEAGAMAAGAALLPQIGAEGFAGRAKEDGAGPARTTNASLQVGWTLDLFGADRSARKAAVAQFEAARFLTEATQLVVSGMVTDAYVEMRYAQRSIALTQRSLESRQKTLELVRAAFDQGAASRMDVLQAEQLVAEAEAALPALKGALAQSVNRLATLLNVPGETLQPVTAAQTAIPQPTVAKADSIAVDTLRNRPDVQAAEQAFLAAAAEIGVANAALYPSLSLTGNVTSATFGGGSVPGSWAFGPTIKLPVFSGGALRAQVKAATARAETSRLEWQASVLTAVEEASTSLALIKRAGESVAAQTRIVDLASEAVDLGRDTLGLGGTDILTLLKAERDLLSARIALAEAERARALAFVRLSLATAGTTSPASGS